MSYRGGKRRLLFAGVAAMAASAASAASAQGGAPAAGDASGSRLAEIVVTAQRRSENLQAVPITVTALSASELTAKGGTSSDDLTAIVPGVVFNAGGGGGQITIRGIGGTNSGSDAGNALYIDGVYQFAPMSSVFDFNAIERVEILKGPQGTLFGRNSAGGLIHVITRDPSTEKMAVEAQVGYASYSTPSANLYLNLPLSETLALNVAAFGWDQNEGWGRNLATGEDAHKGQAYGMRAKLKWASPDGDTDATLAGVYVRTKPVAGAASSIAPGAFAVGGGLPPGLYNVDADAPEYQSYRQNTIALTLHHDFGFAQLTSITAYDNLYSILAVDGDHTPLPLLPVRIEGEVRTTTQEFHLAGDTDRLKWLLGALYLDNSTPGKIRIGPTASVSTTSTRSWAVFGQATYALTEQTKVTAGLRYTDDRLELESGPIHQTTTAKEPTWRLSLDHQFTPNVLGFVSYSRGNKSGLFNGTNPAAPPAQPQQVDAYEVGVKTETSDHRLRVNASFFHYNFKMVQVQLFSPVNSLAYISNAGNAEVNGLDLDAAAEPIRGLTLTAAATYLDNQFTNSPPGFACYQAPPPPAGGLVTFFPCNLEGNALPFAPEFTVSFGAEYKRPTSVGEVAFSVVVTHNSGFYSDPSNFELLHTDEFQRVNASVGWTSTDGRLNASLWAKNLLDDDSIGAGSATPPFGAVIYPMAPQTFGVTLGVKY